MSEGALGMIVFCTITLVISAGAHTKIRDYVVASVVAAPISCALFILAAYLQLGYLDPFFPIIFMFGSCYALGIAFIVGIPFRLGRRKHPPGHCQRCGYNLTGNTSGTCPECGAQSA